MAKIMDNQSTGLQRHRSLHPRKPEPKTPSLQLLIFKVGTLCLALPIQWVYKVTYYEAVYGSGLSDVGLTQIDNSNVTVIDLHRRIFQSKQACRLSTKPCLVIVQGRNRELYGLLVEDTPTLIDLPTSSIRVLPEAYRKADTLDIAKHVAIVPQGEEKRTIFLIDIVQLLKHIHPHSE